MDTKQILDIFFSFTGRIGRMTHFTGLLIVIAVGGTVDRILNALSLDIISELFFIAYAWALLALTVKREQDMDYPAWRLIGLFIPIANIFVGLGLYFGAGTEGKNTYGEPEADNSQIHTLGYFVIAYIFLAVIYDIYLN